MSQMSSDHVHCLFLFTYATFFFNRCVSKHIDSYIPSGNKLFVYTVFEHMVATLNSTPLYSASNDNDKQKRRKL